MPRPAQARRFFRARFRPQDLELVEAGELEVETDFGAIYGDGQDGVRLPAPDFDIGVGIFDWLELNLDSSYSQTQVGTSSSQYVGEPLWLSGMFELYSFEDQKTGNTFGVGLQAGPRLPNVRNADGVGVAGVLMVGGGTEDFTIVGNFGTTVDYDQSPAITYGVDVEWDFDDDEVWSIQGEIAGAHYFGHSSPDQFLVVVGVGAQVTKKWQLLLLGLGGPIYHGDRVGLEAGVVWDYDLWKPKG